MIVLPKKIYLTAVDKHWRVSYIRTPGPLTIIELPYRKLAVYGNRYSKHAAIHMINKWVMLKSKEYLTGLLTKINRRIGVTYKKLRIHALKTEWGSFSSKQILGLNYMLIFLPPRLVRYIIIHELCHAHHLDHSNAFWKVVAKYDKNWKKHQNAVLTADALVPNWVVF